jgi:site-specific recombinase XerD
MTNDLAPTTNGEMITSLPHQADQNPAAVYLASLKESSRRPQLAALNAMARIIIGGDQADASSIPWAALRYQHTAAIRAALLDGYKPATANRMLAALRGTLKQAWLLGLMSADEYQRAVQLSPITGETLPAGRELSSGEIGALMTDCINDPTPGGARDAALIGLMYAAGLRREEVINIDLADFDQATGRLVVHGKRSKERAAYLTGGAADALADWLTLRGSEPGPLFVAINKGGRLLTERMTPQAVYYILAVRAESAGVANFSPHDLRRTFVSDLLEAGADIATVAKMAGHSNIQTTARYDRRPEQAKQAAAKLLHIPYRRRLV